MNYLQMLARLGIGSAHPGGFAATVEQLKTYPLPAGSKVLEVGCGTGRTACYLAQQGCEVTAVDISREMLAKARNRAEKEGVQVRFEQADVQNLPFADAAFDAVLVESVTNFVKAPVALREYYRTLAPGGKLYDREIIAMREIKPDVAATVRDFYGVERLYTADEWQGLLKRAGFRHAEAKNPSSFPENMWAVELQYPDPYQALDVSAYNDPQVWEVAMKYDEIMGTYRDYFGYALMTGEKNESR